MTTSLLNVWINAFIQGLLDWSAVYLMPIMLVTFFGALFARMIVYVIVKAENRFTVEFEKRVYLHRDHAFPETKGMEFHKCVEFLLSKTCNETYVLPATRRSRRGDATLSLMNRLFMIQDGAYRLSKATIESLQFCTKGSSPNFEIVATQAFSSNLYFNKIFGVIPVDLVDETLTILPGLLVVLGIFGTFVGIMQGLPILKTIDVSNSASTSKVLNDFLGSMAYSIGASVFGVFLSVILTVVNTWTSWGDLCVGLVERYRNALVFLWMEREASNHIAATPDALDEAGPTELNGFANFTVSGRAASMIAAADEKIKAAKAAIAPEPVAEDAGAEERTDPGIDQPLPEASVPPAVAEAHAPEMHVPEPHTAEPLAPPPPAVDPHMPIFKAIQPPLRVVVGEAKDDEDDLPDMGDDLAKTG